MLNRRILRIKAFKVIYGYAVKSGMSLEDALSELEASCESTRDLYLFMLAFIAPITDEARARIDAAKRKLRPTEEDLNPNMKFADNALAAYFANDPDFKKLIDKKKLSWERYDILVKKVLDSVKEKPYYQKYMASGKKSLAEDCALFCDIFAEEFTELDDIRHILEDLNLFWIDDLPYALTWCCRSLDDIASGKQWRLPDLYQSDIIRKRNPEAEVDSDRDFVRKLVKEAFTGYEAYFKKVVEMVPEWDSERLFSMDMALIALCLAEVGAFAGKIPARVSLNEYLEISKFYSSPKSRQFVNGILDRVIKENNTTI